MKRTLACLLVLTMCGLAAAAGRRDVNRDGRVDMNDVRALARMAAGLDQADLEYDQNGDGVLTIADVTALQAFVQAQEHAATPAPHRRASSQSPSGRQFLLIEQAADGRVVVAVGTAGIRPGDRILGVYSTLAAAEAERVRLTGGSMPQAPPPVPTPTPSPVPTPTPIPTPAVPPTPELAGTVKAVPVGGGRTLLINGDWRNGWLLGPIGDGSRVNLIHQNLGPMSRWGSRLGIPCALYSTPRRADELFAFLPDVAEGQIFRGLWHPALSGLTVSFSRSIRGPARSVLPLPRQGNSGRTSGVYLYSWPTGITLYASPHNAGSDLVPARHVPGFPLTPHEPVVLPVESAKGATRSYTVIDPVQGTVWLVLDVRPHRYKPQGVRTNLDLTSLASGGGTGGLRIAAAPLYARDGHTSSALVVNGISGRLAVIDNDDNPARIQLRPLDVTINGLLPSRPVPRHLIALTLGRAGGVLILDGDSGRLVRVVPGPGNNGLVTPVEVLR